MKYGLQAAWVYNANLRKEIVEIFEIEAIFLDFSIFSIAHGKLMIETVSFRGCTSLVYIDARKMKSGML